VHFTRWSGHLPRPQEGLPAVEVKQKASPATQEEATVPSPPAKGKDIKSPMVVKVKSVTAVTQHIHGTRQTRTLRG
jgi:hypothetical protein